MQSRRGCGGGADLTGIDGLIPLLILKFLLDVGRQGHLPKAFQHFQKNSFVPEFHHPVAVLPHFPNNGRQLAVSENDLVADLHFPTGLAQALPALVAQVPQKQHLHHAAGGTVPHEPGGQHPGIVHHQTVAGVQIVDDVVKMLMLNFPGFPVQHHQPGTVPPLQRRLGDQLFRQIIPKIMCFHVFPPYSLCPQYSPFFPVLQQTKYIPPA